MYLKTELEKPLSYNKEDIVIEIPKGANSKIIFAILKNKNDSTINFFEKIGSEIGLLFQIADDLIDYKGKTIKVGKKTQKDQKRGKATLISLLGYQNTIIYAEKIKSKIMNKLKKYGAKSKNINETLNYILKRKK